MPKHVPISKNVEPDLRAAAMLEIKSSPLFMAIAASNAAKVFIRLRDARLMALCLFKSASLFI
jgi:hypothetical protein